MIDESVKKIINNYFFISELAPLIEGPEAADLAAASRAYSNILAKFDIKPPLDDFEGCEQAQLLIKWIRDGAADPKLMREWTTAIWAAIADLADGNIPKTK